MAIQAVCFLRPDTNCLEVLFVGEVGRPEAEFPAITGCGKGYRRIGKGIARLGENILEVIIEPGRVEGVDRDPKAPCIELMAPIDPQVERPLRGAGHNVTRRVRRGNRVASVGARGTPLRERTTPIAPVAGGRRAETVD